MRSAPGAPKLRFSYEASGAAQWFKNHLSSARVEMVPRTDDLEARLILADVWDRVLSHVAPGTVR